MQHFQDKLCNVLTFAGLVGVIVWGTVSLWPEAEATPLLQPEAEEPSADTLPADTLPELPLTEDLPVVQEEALPDTLMPDTVPAADIQPRSTRNRSLRKRNSKRRKRRRNEPCRHPASGLFPMGQREAVCLYGKSKHGAAISSRMVYTKKHMHRAQGLGACLLMV